MQMSGNVLSVIIGASIILIGCFVAFMYQKHVFNKYRNKVKNIKDIK